MLKRLAGDTDGARADFDRAAKLGSAFAKKEAVALNPMAQLCNSVMSKVLADAAADADANANQVDDNNNDNNNGNDDDDVDVDTAASQAASKRTRLTTEMDNVGDTCELDD